MKIDGTSIPPVSNTQAVNRLKQVDKKTSFSGADKIAVSDKAQVFQALLQKAKEIPSAREERIHALSEQIKRGEFKIDAQKIAYKLFEINEKG